MAAFNSPSIALPSTNVVPNNETVGGTLAVTGATTLASTLAVTGAATLASTLGVTGNLTLSGTGNAVGTITSGTWNAGAVTSSGALTSATGLVFTSSQKHGATSVTVSSASDTIIAPNGTPFVILCDLTTGGVCLAMVVATVGVTIVSQTGPVVYVTGAPAAAQIQIKDAFPNGVSVLGGATRNGNTLNTQYFTGS